MPGHNHLSIGEVLALLKDDFPDVTISKIRFLESQGLLNPERTPSGYRKFREQDIEQLRWILREQRDNFLPLKVIKERLDSGAYVSAVAAEPGRDVMVEPERVIPRHAPSVTPHVAGNPRGDAGHDPGLDSGRGPKSDSGSDRDRNQDHDVSRSAPARPRRPSVCATTTSLLDSGHSSVSMSAEELSAASGLTIRVIGELERYGLLTSNRLGTVTYFDEHALIVARLAAAFLEVGMEPRHLRMYKIAAEREAGVFEQLMLPLLKQRGPAERHEAIRLLDSLSSLGDQFRTAMLRGALRDHLDRS